MPPASEVNMSGAVVSMDAVGFRLGALALFVAAASALACNDAQDQQSAVDPVPSSDFNAGTAANQPSAGSEGGEGSESPTGEAPETAPTPNTESAPADIPLEPGAGGAMSSGGAGAAESPAESAGASNAGGAPGAGGAGEPGVLPPVSFTPNVRLNDDGGRGRQTEVALATGPNGLALAGWMDERAQRVCAFSVSTDSGLTWSENVSIPLTTGTFVGDPAVAIDAGGTLYAVCQEYGLEQIRLMTSTDRGVTWSANRAIQSAPDKPWAAGGINSGEVFFSWLGQDAGIKRSRDGGLTFGPIQPLGNIIHGTAIVTSTSGLVHVPYNLDSARNQLRYLRSSDGGNTWDNLRDLVPNMGRFCFQCQPRQHPIVGAASDPAGKVVAITWASQMPAGQPDDDVWLLYSDDGGVTWTNPIRVNDNTTNSRQFQPWVAVDAHGRVHVAWTDLRDDGLNKTFYARSADPRKGFEPSIQVTDQPGTAQLGFLGDYKGIAISGTDVLIVWQDTRRDTGDIYFSRAAGAAGP